MKIIAITFTCLMIITNNAKAQNAKPEYLKAPASWQFERFALPPSFATAFPYKGVEELRFSPGMFNKDSSDYFSYAFVARLDNAGSFTQEEVRNYLLVYFKGLCANTARQRNLSIDTSQITVSTEEGVRVTNPSQTQGSLEKTSSNNGPITYNAVLKIFGVFSDGAPVTLNAEIKVLNNSKDQKTYLVFIASPQNKTNFIWQQLYAIQKDFSVSGN
jgi:hypothetical protein